MALHAQMCWKNLIGIARVLAAMKDRRVKYVNFHKISSDRHYNFSTKFKFKSHLLV